MQARYCFLSFSVIGVLSITSCKTADSAKAGLQSKHSNSMSEEISGDKHSLAGQLTKALQAGKSDDEAADGDLIGSDKHKVSLKYGDEKIKCSDLSGGKYTCSIDIGAERTGGKKYETKWQDSYGMPNKLYFAILSYQRPRPTNSGEAGTNKSNEFS